MPINNVRRKIHHLRRQPEDVRLRAASYITLVGGILLSILWVTVLLPVQLRLSGGIDEKEESQQEEMTVSNNDNLKPRVGGATDESTPKKLFHTAPPQAEAGGTIINSTNTSPSSTESQTSGPVEATNENTSSDPETVPVDVTE